MIISKAGYKALYEKALLSKLHPPHSKSVDICSALSHPKSPIFSNAVHDQWAAQKARWYK
jgi:hypothetical protein